MQIIPYNENKHNAIKGVAFAIEFTDPINDKQLDELIKIYNSDESLNKLLPRFQEAEQVVVQVSGPSQNSQKPTRSGVMFDSIKENGEVNWAVVPSGLNLVIQCNDYSRWDEVWGKAKEYIYKLSPALKECTVKRVGLEYMDKFFILDKEMGWADKLFKKESDFIARNIFKIDDLWHSHHGFFEKNSNNEQTLTRINIDHVSDSQNKDNLEEFCVEIRTHHSTSINTVPLKEICATNALEEEMLSHHQKNKDVLKNLLIEDVLKEIGLKE